MRHLSDLKALAPTDEEMLDAAKWCLRQDASDAFPTLVQTFLEKAGYGSLVQQLDPTNPK